MGLGCCPALKVSASYLTKWFIFRMKNNPLNPFLHWAHDDCLDFARTGDYEVSHSKMVSWHLSKKIPYSQVEILDWRIFFKNKWINSLCYNSNVSGLSVSVSYKHVTHLTYYYYYYFKFIYFILCSCVYFLHVCIHIMCVFGDHSSQEWLWVPLDWLTVSYHMNSRN